MSNTPSALAPARALAPAQRAGRLVERLRRISLVSWALPAALLHRLAGEFVFRTSGQ